MPKYLLLRSLQALLIVWGVSSLIFLLIHLAPGDPASLYVRPDISPEVVAGLRQQLGLDLPLTEQYFRWMASLFRGNLGVSFAHHRTVSDLLKETLPNTIQLTAIVFVIQFVAGILLGILMAVKRHSKTALTLNSLLLLIYSLPGFWLALMGILIFSVKLGWLPSSHMASLTADGNLWNLLLDRLRHLLLPAAVLVLPFTAYTARFVEGSLTEVLDSNYIRTARAYGLSRRIILWKYALKNALLPQATLFGLYLPFLISGAAITEFIFSWPGMGNLTIKAILTHDYPVILACTMLSAVAVVIGNFLSDVLYAFLDPRIKLVQ